MKDVTRLVKRFVSNEAGLETVEYAVMTALVVAAVITAVVALRTAIIGRFDAVTTAVNTP